MEYLNDHIIGCNKEICHKCAELMITFFPIKKAQAKYRQTEKYKEYKRQYYQKNRKWMDERARQYYLKK